VGYLPAGERPGERVDGQRLLLHLVERHARPSSTGIWR
jgi:hypothetical protein